MQAEEKDDSIRLWLLQEDDLDQCIFWASLYKSGKLAPNEACRDLALAKRLMVGATKGFQETGPIMITESHAMGQEYVLYFPWTPTQKTELLIAEMTEVIGGWRPQQLGLNFSDQLIGKSRYREFYEDLLLAFIKGSAIKDYYFNVANNLFSDALQVLANVRARAEGYNCRVNH